MRSYEKWIRIVLTLLIVTCIGVLSYVLYIGLNQEGEKTEISSVKTVGEKDTPVVKDEKDKPKLIQPELQIPEVIETPVEEEQPSIIVDKPIRREQDDREIIGGELQSSVQHEDGAILEVLESVQIIPDVENTENTVLTEALRIKKERELRNQGRILSGIEVALFVDSKGEKLDMTDILSKKTVVIPWYSNDDTSVEYVSTLNKLYTEYKDKLNIIFLSANTDNQEFTEDIVKEKGFSFKCYYDASATFLGYTEARGKTEVLFINKDDYIVKKLTSVTSLGDLRNEFEALIAEE